MDNKTEPKVLVGCLVHEGQDFCIDPFWKAVQEQDHKNLETVFTTYSEEVSLHKRMEKTGAKVLKGKKEEQRIQSVISCRRLLKEHFMDSDYDFLLLIEADIILPKNAISRLLFHKKDLISGVHLTNMELGDRKEICPSLFDFAEEGSLRVMELREIIDDKLMEVFCSSLGCTLASKKVIEKTGFRFFESSMSGDDIAFFVDARDNGFDAFADTSVKCNRRVKPEGDRLNEVFSFDSHPKIRCPRVLVSCVTYDKDELYLEGFLEAIRSQEYRNYDILFVDTSDSKEFTAKLKGTGAIVVSAEAGLDHNIKRITAGREQARQHALKNGYDYLLFVDTDVRPPPNALSKLLANRKDVIAGVCLSPRNINGTSRVMPNIYDFADEKGYCRPMFLNEVLNNDLVEVSCAGFGCTLITRAVLEKVQLRFYKESMAGEDIAFFVDARENKFRTFADNSVKCRHLVFPPGDPRNRKFFFESHQTGTSYSFSMKNVSKD